ncbi:MAG: hypothetical protein LBP26_06580 [Clostridiales bacterium]|nr:hypothetical protein [Clostridiales bacterium]MDR2202403.1 hypothetical protein [Clostridiales bacterium]
MRFVIGSDAHDPADVGRADNVFELIKDLDVAALIDNIDGRTIRLKKSRLR